MPVYNFHVYDGVDIINEIGIELPGIFYARREAIRYAGSLIEKGAGLIKPGCEWRMDVTDVTGLLFFQIDFSITQSPAADAAMERHLASTCIDGRAHSVDPERR